MPYKAVGIWVYVLRNGRWVKYKKRQSVSAAKKMAAALNINVKH